MNVETLKSFALARGLNQSDLAKAAGVTRQAVSGWFAKQGEIEVLSSTLQRLADSLGVSVETLSRPLPILSSPDERAKWETELLWDKLYPNLESFLAALKRGQRPALARLVQVCGLYQAEKIAGRQVFHRFERYKNYIHPAHRRQAELLWKTR